MDIDQPWTLRGPDWVDGGTGTERGLDLLGLRQPALVVSNYLLDGITTVTPHVRYLTFRSWIIRRYIDAGGPDASAAFRKFALAAEAAIAIGNVIHERNVFGLIGGDGARARSDSSDPTLSLEGLVKTPATSLYQGPSRQLGISPLDESGRVPGLTKERGVVLADLLEGALGKDALAVAFRNAVPPMEASRDALSAFSEHTILSSIPDDEREALIGCLMPAEPVRQSEVRRARTYALLLSLGQALQRMPTAQDVFARALAAQPFGLFEHGCYGWLIYAVRDLIAVSHEFAANALLGELANAPERRDIGTAVVERVLGRSDEGADLLRRLGLLAAGEDLLALSVRDLRQRVIELAGETLPRRAGVTRWHGPLAEHVIAAELKTAGDGAVALLPFVWVLACERLQPGAEGDEGFIPGLDGSGWGRMGVDAVIRPEVDAALLDGSTVAAMAARAAHRVVDQHLRIAWARLRVELQSKAGDATKTARDVSLLRTEGEQWTFAQAFTPGQTSSRLDDAARWLSQLGLLGDDGLTADGELQLTKVQAVLTARSV